MKRKKTGSEFVAEVSNALAQRLKCPEWIELLYDVLEKRGESQVFEELAFEGKSFQKLTRLFGAGISDEATKEKIEVEIGSALKRFYQLLERTASGFQEEDRKQFEREFLSPTASSFENVRTLLNDFSMVKDFYLLRRDKGSLNRPYGH
ncbi:MAG: hypothetical protein ACLP05_05270 [Candidatus Kryptoniota bacterium]